MHFSSRRRVPFAALSVGGVVTALTAFSSVTAAQAAPVVQRLTPPSRLFSNASAVAPITARFLPDQRFDLQATIRMDDGATLASAVFAVDGAPVAGTVTPTVISTGAGANRVSVALRAYANSSSGIHTLTVTATQNDNQTVTATGNFEVIAVSQVGRRARNVIYFIGDGMGIAHRTAARLMLRNAQQGKALGLLAMDTAPFTGIAMVNSLNSIVTDSAPGAACYANGNKSNNNEEGVFPDDTAAPFDNPRVENIGEYLFRKQGKTLGIVTTADVFDATPAAFAVHTSNRGAGTGIVDQYFDERGKTGLRVLMGGGRKWFLPNATGTVTPQPSSGSQRATGNDYVLPADVAAAYGIPAGVIDPARDLIADFQGDGYQYASSKTVLDAVPLSATKLLGLFSFSNMNVAKDKIDKRRTPGTAGIVDDYGFPDQPMLDEMTDKALQVLNQNRMGFTLMVEGASIDKQAHNMDAERMILDTIEMDRAVQRALDFQAQNPDTLIVITADHECGGINIIGASRVTNAALTTAAAGGGGASTLRDPIVGTYELAGFPAYTIAADGYPVTTDINNKMLIGFAANSDRNEDWLTNARPLQDTQQPFVGASPLNTYPATPLNRDAAGAFLVTGQVPGGSAVHTASDIPVSAFGRGAALFTGVMDNTDVFFRVMQVVLGGAK